MRTFTPVKRTLLFCLAFFCFSLVQTKAQTSCGFISQITNPSVINKCNESPLVLNSQPIGASYSYRWQKQTAVGAPFADIAGAVASSYTASEIGAYRVLISNATCTDTSGIFNLIKIDLQGGAITGGSSAPICRDADAGTLKGNIVAGYELGLVTFQWEKNVNNTGWTVISGATGVDYKVPALSGNTAFRRASVDGCGKRANSNTITINTFPELLGGGVAPLQQTIASGALASQLNSATPASGGSGGLTYQWSSSLFERGGYTDIPGATSANYSPGSLQQTTYFRRTALDPNCKTSVSIEQVAVVIVVGSPLNAGYFNSNSNCFFPGQLASPLEASNQTGGVAPYTIEWQSSLDNNTWTTIPGSVGRIFQPPALTQSTYFRMKVTDAAGNVAYSGSEKISKVESVLTGGLITAAANVACLGSPVAPINSKESPRGFAEMLSFQWQYRVTGSSVWVDIPGQIRENILPEAITEKTFFRRVAMDACGPNTRKAFSNEVEIDIRPALVPGSISPTAQIVFRNGTPNLLRSIEAPSGGTGSYTLSWEKSALAVGPWSVINGEAGVSYQPSSLSEPTYYKRVVKDNNCLATKYTYVVEVTVNNSPPLIGGWLVGSTCVFPGNRPGLIEYTGAGRAGGGTPPLSFQWEHRAGNTGPFITIAGATAETFQPNIITQTHQYRRKVTDVFGMFAYSDTMTIHYVTTPLNAGTIKATTAQSVCGSTIPGIIESVVAMSGFVEYASYQWQISTDGVVWKNIVGEIRESYKPTAAITQETLFRRWALDKCSGVTRSAVSNEVIFKILPEVPLKGGLVDGPFITCAGTAPGPIVNVLEACGSGGNKYQWEINTGSGWTTIDGATGSSYTPGILNGNTTFRRKVVDACGKVAYSNEVLIYVYPKIEPGYITGGSQNECGTPGKLELTAACHYTDGTVSYQWESSTNGTTWSNINGANDRSYLPGNESKWYRLKVMSTTCNAFVYTNTISVTGSGISLSCPKLIPDGERVCRSSRQPFYVTISTAGCAPIPNDSKIEWQLAEEDPASNQPLVWLSANSFDRERLNVRPLFLADDYALIFRLKITDKCGKIEYRGFARVLQVDNCKTAGNTWNVKVYPNPTRVSNELTLKTNMVGRNTVTIKTAEGNILNVIVLSNDRGIMKIKLPHHLASGPYFLQVANENGEKATEKIVVAN